MKKKAPLVPELYVSDLRVSLEFYIELLGFEMEFDRLEQGFAALDLGTSRIMLEQARWFAPSTAAEMREGRWIPAALEAPFGRGINFEVEVDDVEAVHQRFKKRGYPLAVEIHEKSYRVANEHCVVRQFLAADPDGYLIRPSQTLEVTTNPSV